MTLNEIVALHQEDMIQTLQELVQIKSVLQSGENGYPFGQGNHDCLEYCLRLGQSLAFTARNIDEMCGYLEYGQGEHMIAVLVHLDVVPEGEGWSYPPYEGVIADNRLYSRGSLDDKGPAIAAIYALKAIRDSGLALKHRIRIIFGLNEENGSKGMAYYRSNGEELPIMGFTPDAGYPVIHGEKGNVTLEYKLPIKEAGHIPIVSLVGGTATNVVPDRARAVVQMPGDLAEQMAEMKLEHIRFQCVDEGLLIEAEGVAAHGGRPQAGVNAIVLLFQGLSKLPLDGDTGRLVDFICSKFELTPWGEALGIAMSDAQSGPLTVSLSIVKLVEEAVALTVNIRYPVTCEMNQFYYTLHQLMDSHGFCEQTCAHKKSLYLPPESELVQKLLTVYEAQTGARGEPRCIGGGTYAKSLPNLVAFGPNFPGDESRIHKSDEYMELDKLVRHAQMNAAAMYELAK